MRNRNELRNSINLFYRSVNNVAYTRNNMLEDYAQTFLDAEEFLKYEKDDDDHYISTFISAFTESLGIVPQYRIYLSTYILLAFLSIAYFLLSTKVCFDFFPETQLNCKWLYILIGLLGIVGLWLIDKPIRIVLEKDNIIPALIAFFIVCLLPVSLCLAFQLNEKQYVSQPPDNGIAYFVLKVDGRVDAEPHIGGTMLIRSVNDVRCQKDEVFQIINAQKMDVTLTFQESDSVPDRDSETLSFFGDPTGKWWECEKQTCVITIAENRGRYSGAKASGHFSAYFKRVIPPQLGVFEILMGTAIKGERTGTIVFFCLFLLQIFLIFYIYRRKKVAQLAICSMAKHMAMDSIQIALERQHEKERIIQEQAQEQKREYQRRVEQNKMRLAEIQRKQLEYYTHQKENTMEQKERDKEGKHECGIEGKRVKHSVYGSGIVVSVKKDVAEIRFDTMGLKSILYKNALAKGLLMFIE